MTAKKRQVKLSEQLANLANVFVAARPAPNASEQEQADSADSNLAVDQEPEQPQTIQSELTGLTLVAGARFNGSSSAPPWNWPESQIFQWLSGSPLEIIEERVLGGVNGIFWGRMRLPSGDPQSVLVRFAGIGRDDVVDVWGTELFLDDGPSNLLSREVAGYEVAKALGDEDLAVPVAIKELNPVELISDTTRSEISKKLRIGHNDVDQRLGIAATVQIVPRDLDNFAEHWATLGSTNNERWRKATDQLRFSLYRIYFLDFIIGTVDRPIPSLGYNMNTDRVIATDLSASFPHSGFTAEKYMQMRLTGWGRQRGGFAGIDDVPPSTGDLASLFVDLDEQFLDEAMMTAVAITNRMTDTVVGQLATVCIENDVPIECVASMVLRLAYLGFSPGSVVKRPVEFIRNLCVPVRADVADADARIQAAIEYVNEIMSVVTSTNFDMVGILMQDQPEDAEMVV